MTAFPDAKTLSLARQERLGKVRAHMAEHKVEVLLLSLGADMPWLSGYQAMPLERPTVLVVPVDQDPTLVVPRLEAPRVRTDEALFHLRPWNESENPVRIVADLVGNAKSTAVSDRMWAVLLLALQEQLPNVSFRRASAITGPLRAIKDAIEITALVAAGEAADVVASALVAGEIPLIGRSEAAVSKEISERLLEAGHAKVNFAIVGSGPNAASPHHEPGERIIGQSESVVCDFGGSFIRGEDVGYCSDITRTVVTGSPPPEFVELYSVLEHAQATAVKAVAPGLLCSDVDRIGREIIDAGGYGEYFIHRIGHGIGIEEHEDPYIVAGNDTALTTGHAFSVEPGIYLEGRMGARVEDIVIANENGTIVCNAVDHALHTVDV